MGNHWHRGACVQSPAPSPLPQQHPAHLPGIPPQGLFLQIYCLGSSLLLSIDLSLLIRTHLSCNQSSLFQLGRQDQTLKCLCWAKLVISGCSEMAGGRRGNMYMTFLPRKKQLKILVFIRTHISALHLKSKHCSTKNPKRRNETTARTSTTQAQKMLTAGHKEQHKKIILLLTGQ